VSGDPVTAVEWDALDRQMVGHASRREPVLFLDRHNNEFRVTLLAWRGRLGRTRARIRYPSGREATVDTALLRPVPPLPQ